jgi:hypothetical protein
MSSREGSKPRTRLVPEPPAPFPTDVRIQTIKAGLVLHRIHDHRVAGASFDSSEICRSRFAPIFDETDQVVPVLYAGGTIPCAFYETLFHDHLAANGLRVMNHSDIEDRRYSAIRVDRPLRLVSLLPPDLARLNLTPDQLTHCKAVHYRYSARWAEAINRAFDDIDGLVWTSYRGDSDFGYLLFGNRGFEGSVVPIRQPSSLLEELDLRKVLHDCASHRGVRLNVSTLYHRQPRPRFSGGMTG